MANPEAEIAKAAANAVSHAEPTWQQLAGAELANPVLRTLSENALVKLPDADTSTHTARTGTTELATAAPIKLAEAPAKPAETPSKPVDAKEKAADVATPPEPASELRDRAMQDISAHTDQIRQRFTPEQKELLTDVERYIVDAKPEALADRLHKYAGNPVGIEDVMNAAVRDFRSVDILSFWNYSPRSQDPRTPMNFYDPKAPKDIGHLTFTLASRSGAVMTLRFSTEGTPKAQIAAPTMNTEPVTAAIATRTLRDYWLRRTMRFDK